MTSIDLLGGSYKAKYTSLNSQRTINWYPAPGVKVEQDKNPNPLFPTPGLTTFLNISSGTFWRGIHSVSCLGGDRCFAVRDNILYEIFINKTSKVIGTLANLALGTSRVYMTVNSSSELAIFHPSASYVYSLLSGTLSQITHPQFPGTATYATYLDTFNVILSGGAAWISQSGSALFWIGTQTYNTTFTASPILALGVFQECLYNFTGNSIENYAADGTSTSVYTRQARTTISIGIVAKDSLAQSNTGFYFLGKDERGECSVYFLKGGWFGTSACTAVSPASITWRLNSLGTSPTDAFGYVQHTKDGRIFYYLSVPSLKTTFVFDEMSQEWHERQSKKPNNDSDGANIYTYFRGNYYTNFNGQHLFTDRFSGKILIEDYNNQTEDGCTIIRDRQSQTFADEQHLISATELELEYNPGATGNGDYYISIAVSYNGGATFQDPVLVSLGQQAQYDTRIKLYKLGAGRRFVVWIRVSDPVDIMLQNAVVQASIANY